MVKIIIANNNDILYNRLNDIALKNERKIEIINTPIDKLSSLIYQTRTKENLIILDSITSVTFYKTILKNAINRQIGKENITIIVINSNSIANNIIDHERHHHFFFRKKVQDFSVLDVVNLISNSLKESLEIEKNIDSILWQIGLTPSFKAYNYIKDAITFAYTDKNLLLDTKTLVKKVADKNNILNDKVVRSDMDKALNSVLDLLDTNILYDIFENDYDGRKISLKYFIGLCIRYLEKQKDYCFY